MDGTVRKPDFYVIGELELEPSTRRLRRRDGTPVHLANRPFQVLVYLVEHRDRLVTRAELLDRFWDGRHVYDDSLTRCVSTIRKALGDEGATPRYLETRWAEGYRFIGVCEPRERAAALPARSRDKGLSAELYRRGLAHHYECSSRGQRYALHLFLRALAHDPENARIWAGIAGSRVLLCLYANGTQEDRQLAADATERALTIDPFSAEAHVARAQLAVLRNDHAAAHEAFRYAEELDPNQFFAWLGHARCRASLGDHERAVELYEKAAQAHPCDFHALALAEQSYRKLGLRADAQHAAERSVTAGDAILAREPDNVRALSLVSSLLPLVGRSAEARAWTQRACYLEPDEPFVNVNAACTYVELRDFDRALQFVERIPLTEANRQWLDQDATLDPLREEPRFEALMRRRSEVSICNSRDPALRSTP